jgi:Cu-processing system permease protein
MWQHMIVAWRSGFRSRSFQALFILGLLAMAGAFLSAEFSGRQPATIALDVGLSGVRFVLLLMVLFWCQELVAREVERRTVFLALAYPASRSSYLLGRYFGMLLLILAALLVLGALLYVTTRLAALDYTPSRPVNLGAGYLLTLVYIAVDVSVVTAFTLLISAFSTTPLLPFALGGAFAVAAHGIGPALDFLADKNSGAAEHAATLGPIVNSIRWILPDLSKLDVRTIALYDVWPTAASLVYPLVMATAYIGIMLALATYIFRKREFS